LKQALRSGFPLLIFCLLTNLLQARFTELFDDESYYWMYSRFPAWGYFDHPPMVALFIKVGYAIFHNELGVRLLTVLGQIGTLYFIWRLVENPAKEKYRNVFLLIALAIPVFQVYGFITTPDVPLLFFAAMFFNIYKSYSEKITTLNTIGLGIGMALLLYSKHHGLLLLVLIVLSNLRLFKTPSFYVACFVGLVILIPQFIWQIQHDFPSIYYHFYWRASEFRIDNVTGFLVAQLFVFSPFLFPWLMVILLKKKIILQKSFERALLFVFWGFLVYFFIFSFRTRIEGHWTALICLPIIYFVFNFYLNNEEKIRKRIIALSLVSAIVVFAVRPVLVFDVLPIKTEFHKSAAWTKQVYDFANGAGVIFSSSFQKASKYSFYTNTYSLSMNSIYYRQNQFDIWNLEENFNQKPVVIIYRDSQHDSAEKKIILCNTDTFYALRFEHFETTQKIHFSFKKPDHAVKKMELFTMPIDIQNNYPYSVNFHNPEMPLIIKCYLCQFGHIKSEFEVELKPGFEINKIEAGQTIHTTAYLNIPDITGVYNMGFSIASKNIPSTFNSTLRLITIN
jgi:hypothetical protein